MNFSNDFKPLKIIILRIKKTSISTLMNQYRNYKNLLKNNPKFLLELINKLIKGQIRALKTKSIYSFIAKNKFYQFNNYELLKGKFSSIYSNLRKFDLQKFTTPPWNEYNKKIEISFLPFPPFSFLNHPVIRKTMFLSSHVKWIKEELKFIESNFSFSELRYLLLEDYIGMPEISILRYSTSNTTIHHFYSICKFLHITKCDLNEISTIVEWGGGYGNMAKILLRMIKKKITYIIIDTPLFSCIQWLYLASIHGSHNINLIQNSNDKIEPLKINLLPVCFIENYELRANLFISTWALSESSKGSQDFVAKSKWFNSEHVLLAYSIEGTKYPDTKIIEKYAKEMNLTIENIGFLKGRYYAMK